MVEPTDLAADALESRRLLSFYDRLRERVVEGAARRHRRHGRAVAEALLLAPDLFLLLARLTLDRRVPAEARALFGGALAYFLAPFDLFPEALVGGAGFLDDLLLAAAVLSRALGGELEAHVARHWNGSEDLRLALRGAAEGAGVLLGGRLVRRLNRLAGRSRGS